MAHLLPAVTGQMSRAVAARPVFFSSVEYDVYDRIHLYLGEHPSAGPQVHCRFYNMSSHPVDIIWCREESQLDYIYNTIMPKRYSQVLTFEGHPWIVRSTDDGELMAIHENQTCSRIFYPRESKCRVADGPHGAKIRCQLLFIKTDVAAITLQRACLRQIARYFSTDDLLNMDLPPQIMANLIEFYANKIAYTYGIRTQRNPQTNVHELAPDQEHLAATRTVMVLLEILDQLDKQGHGVDFGDILRKMTANFPKVMRPDGSDVSIDHTDTPSTSTASIFNNNGVEDVEPPAKQSRTDQR